MSVDEEPALRDKQRRAVLTWILKVKKKGIREAEFNAGCST